MKKRFALILSFAVVAMFLSSCSKDDNVNNPGVPTIKAKVSGYVLKGPFINGSSITIFELNAKLNQTGRVYSTSILNNSGKFEINEIELASNFIELKGNGFYFNENTGENSNAPLTLYAYADIASEVNSVNVNILTHLEKGRIDYLVKEQNYSFANAKKKAQAEVLNIFNIKKEDIDKSENLCISEDGDDNAILLAISIIFQGFRNTADMSQLIADIVSNIREDGVLTNNTLGAHLLDDAKLLDLNKIRGNIEKRYSDLGLTVTIPDFEKYINHFIATSNFPTVKKIEYPYTGEYGINILNEDVTMVKWSDDSYSMAANLPTGRNLKIVLRRNDKKGILAPWNLYNTQYPNWFIDLEDPDNEVENDENCTPHLMAQVFKTVANAIKCDMKMSFLYSSVITIEYYENNSPTPTKIKHLVVEE